MTERLKKVLELAKSLHAEQKRKYTGEPYWKHPLAVAKIVSKIDNSEVTFAIALLHDTVEDVDGCTLATLKEDVLKCGFSGLETAFIIGGVKELSDVYTHEAFPQMNRNARNAAEIERLATISPSSQTIKYADLIHNTSSITKYDKDFSVVYLKEKRKLLDKMRQGNLGLFVKCYNILLKSEIKLAKERKKL